MYKALKAKLGSHVALWTMNGVFISGKLTKVEEDCAYMSSDNGDEIVMAISAISTLLLSSKRKNV